MEEHNKLETEVALEEKKHKNISLPQAVLINGFVIAVAIIIGAFIIHGTFGSGRVNDQAAAELQPSVPVDIKNATLAGEPFIGNPEAKVVVAYWSDYQCPYCKKFEVGPFQDILKNYVASGDVAVVFKDYSFLGPDSTTAALYERAVWNLYPDSYFAWREAMFAAQDEENAGFGDEASVLKLSAAITGIDSVKLQADVKKNHSAYTKLIEASRLEGVGFGIKGTPSFVTGTIMIGGYVEYKTFAVEIDKQLKKLKK